MIFPRLTRTAPTIGLGEVWPSPRAASRSARRINRRSLKRSSGMVSFRGGEQRLGELLRVEGLQVVCFFAQANEKDRQAELFLDGDDHAALAGAIEFGDDEAGDFDR